MTMPLVESIIGLCKEGLAAYKTYLSTRQEAYNRQQDRKQIKAIESAEKYIFESDKLLAKIGDDKYCEEVNKLIYWRKRFFKFH